MKWFRFYDEVVDDPKVQKLPDKLFRTWVNVLCLWSRNGGKLPPLEEIAFGLRIRAIDARARIDDLLAAGLLEHQGEMLVVHNWNARQYKSDNSTERVTKFRKRPCNVSETPLATPPETETEQNRAEAESDARDLPPLALAQKVAAECCLQGPVVIQAIAGAISFCVKHEGKSNNAAVEFLIAHVKDEIERGGAPDRFWFESRKWRKGDANGKARAARANRGFVPVVE